jgi:hypothetical protein
MASRDPLRIAVQLHGTMAALHNSLWCAAAVNLIRALSEALAEALPVAREFQRVHDCA